MALGGIDEGNHYATDACVSGLVGGDTPQVAGPHVERQGYIKQAFVQ
jgi:hypothetical protein